MQGTNVPKQPTIPAMPNKREMGGKAMSKKYIIEIEDAPYMAEEGNTSIALYKAVGFNSLVFDKNGLDKLAPLDKARPSWLEEAYQRGLDDAWEAARKIVIFVEHGGLSREQLLEIFGTRVVDSVFERHTAAEAIEKIREYEESKAQENKIRNGDEVRFTIFGQDYKAIAIQKDISGYWQALNDRGFMSQFAEDDLTKTGRHVDLSELFGGGGE